MIFLFNNTSIIAILFGIAFLFISLSSSSYRGITKYFVYAVMLILSYFIFKLNSRTVWVGIGAVLLVVFLITASKKKKLHAWSLFISLALIAFAFCFYKQDSTSGRLLIYKINFQLLKKYWLTGIDTPYSIAFNHAQAEYFQTHTTSIHESLLADNGFFAMNEYLSVFVQYGIVGILIVLMGTYFLLKVCLKQLITHPQKKPVIGTVFFLFITSITSYPFHFNLYCCIFVCSVVYIIKDETRWLLITKRKWFVRCLYILSFLFFLYNETRSYTITKQVEYASKLNNQGYINEALASSLTQLKSAKENGALNYLAARIYFQKDMLDSSLHYLQNAHHYLCTDDIHLFWGNYLSERGLFNDANTHYKLAVNIVPCRFKNRLALIQNSIALKEYNNAIQYAQYAIELPEKIPSAQSALYKQKIKVIYDTLIAIKKVKRIF